MTFKDGKRKMDQCRKSLKRIEIKSIMPYFLFKILIEKMHFNLFLFILFVVNLFSYFRNKS